MAELTYDRLKNNIVDEKVNGATVTVTFKCPVTDKTYNASATMPRKTGVGQRVKQRAKNELLYAAKRGFRSLLRGVLGSGTVGRAATNVATSAAPAGVAQVEYDQKGGVVAAFSGIAGKFAWSDEKQAYVDASELEGMTGDYDRQLRDHPLEKAWDKGVAARMLAEIVAADGKVEDEEREFFEGFAGAETGTLEEIMEKGPLNKVEMEEVTPDVRATALMLATSVALCDEKLDAAEQEKLASFAQWFDINPDRQDALRNWASEKVIENMLTACYADGRLDDDEKKQIDELAANIGVNQALVQKIEVRVRKRLGA